MPLTIAQKLKIKEGDSLLTVHAPATFSKHLGVLPAGVEIADKSKTYNQLHWFVTNKAQVEKESKKIIASLKNNVICWIYFPKGTSKIQTDLTRDKGWDALSLHNHSLTWMGLISFDATWSAFAIRLKNTADVNKTAKPKERPILQYIDAASKSLRLPDDLMQAFEKNKTAADFFNTLSFTNRKEYIEWIVTAKQQNTRNSRINGTLERLVNHWKNPRNI